MDTISFVLVSIVIVLSIYLFYGWICHSENQILGERESKHTITIDGVTYNKKEVKKLIKGVEPIK